MADHRRRGDRRRHDERRVGGRGHAGPPEGDQHRDGRIGAEGGDETDPDPPQGGSDGRGAHERSKALVADPTAQQVQPEADRHEQQEEFGKQDEGVTDQRMDGWTSRRQAAIQTFLMCGLRPMG